MSLCVDLCGCGDGGQDTGAELQTIDNTTTPAVVVPTVPGARLRVKWQAWAHSDAPDDGFFWRERVGIIRNVGGVVTIEFDTIASNELNANALILDEVISGSTVELSVRGENAITYDWHVRATVYVEVI
jgi:hypothetical protein